MFYVQLRAIAHLLGVCFTHYVCCAETQHGCVHGNCIYECPKIRRSLPSLLCFADNNQKSPCYILLSLFNLHSSLFTLLWSLIFFTLPNSLPFTSYSSPSTICREKQSERSGEANAQLWQQQQTCKNWLSKMVQVIRQIANDCKIDYLSWRRDCQACWSQSALVSLLIQSNLLISNVSTHNLEGYKTWLLVDLILRWIIALESC